MVNKNKQRGSTWEKDLADMLTARINDSEWKRIPASGAIGTSIGEPLLTGDVKGEVINFPKKFRVECKTGYGGKTQLSVKKEWLDKIVLEADNLHALPLLACKFSDARSGVKHFMVLPIGVFIDVINMYTDLYKELNEVYKELEKCKKIRGN